MKLHSALIAAAFALLIAGMGGCPCYGNLSGDNAPGAETFYYCDGGPPPA